MTLADKLTIGSSACVTTVNIAEMQVSVWQNGSNQRAKSIHRGLQHSQLSEIARHCLPVPQTQTPLSR